MAKPRLQKEARDRAEAIAKRYKEDIKNIAEAIAKNEESEATVVRHIEVARDALAASGLRRQRWFHRSEFLVGLGTLLVGLSPGVASIAYQLTASVYGTLQETLHSKWFWLCVVGLPLVMLLGGVTIAVWSWSRRG